MNHELLFKMIIASALTGLMYFVIRLLIALFKKIIGYKSILKLWYLSLLILVFPFIPINEFVGNPGYESALKEIIEIPTLSSATVTAYNNTRVLFENNQSFISSAIVIQWIWLIGMMVFIIVLFTAYSHFRFKIAFKSVSADSRLCSIAEHLNKMAGYRKKVTIRIMNGIESPCVVSGFRPLVLFPKDLSLSLNDNELYHIYAHELAHIQRRDDREILCDEIALSIFPTNNNSLYAKTLLNLSVNKNKTLTSLATITMTGNAKKIERRIIEIMNKNSKSKKGKLLQLTIISITIILFIGAATASAMVIHNEHSVDTTIENKLVINEQVKTTKEDDNQLSFQMPIDNMEGLTSPYGSRPSTATIDENFVEKELAGITFLQPKVSNGDFHNGIDLAGMLGSSIYAVEDGYVQFSDKIDDHGNTVIIKHANNVYTIYTHCEELIAREGTTVMTGEEIATIGSTGKATGPHLHFMVIIDGYSVDPVIYLPY